MDLNIESRMSGGGRNPTELIGEVRSTINQFFAYCPVELGNVRFVVQEAKFGGSAAKKIKLATPTKAAEVHSDAVTVNVYTHGTQGAVGFMIVHDYDAKKLKDLLMNGPYDKKPRPKPATSVVEPSCFTSVAAAVAEIAPVIEVPPVQLPVVPSVVVSEVVPQVPRLTPLEKLQRAGLGPEEINRLKETLSVIVQEETVRQGFTQPQNLLRVSVTTITRAILDHMKLPVSKANNYQGVVGSFYSTKIALFALKYDEKTDSQYEDWLFDCELITDFVGGHDRLEALALVRKSEVRALEHEVSLRQPAPEPGVVEQAVQEGFMPDNQLFDLALRFLAGKDQAVRELELANENLQKEEVRLNGLLAQVELAQQAVAEAFDLVRAAQEKVGSLVLTDAAKNRIFRAKANLDALVSRLG